MNRQFWRATAERGLRGAFAAVFAAYVAGDLIFDVMNVHTWNQAGSLAVGGAFSAIALSIIGNGVSKNGPSFTSAEITPDSVVPVANQRGQGQLLYILCVIALVFLLVWVVLAVFGGR